MWRVLVLGAGLALCLSTLSQMGCGSAWGNAGIAAGATAAGAHSPNNEIEETYYLGIFDPQEQMPPSVYRVRVHGQASFISLTKFASGWVPAEVVDTLGTRIEMDTTGGRGIVITKDNENTVANALKGRGLMLFGPEGFREAPRNHRLVIVMGTSPEDYFNALNEGMAKAQLHLGKDKAADEALQKQVLDVMTRMHAERKRLNAIEAALPVVPAAPPANPSGSTN